MEWDAKSQIVLASGVSFALIIALLVLPVFASKDTMFFVTSNSNSTLPSCNNQTIFYNNPFTDPSTGFNDFNSVRGNNTTLSPAMTLIAGESNSNNDWTGKTLTKITIPLAGDNSLGKLNYTYYVGVFGQDKSTKAIFGTFNASGLYVMNSDNGSSLPTLITANGNYVLQNNDIVGIMANQTKQLGQVFDFPPNSTYPDNVAGHNSTGIGSDGTIQDNEKPDTAMLLYENTCDVDNVYKLANTVSSNFQIFKNSTTIGNTVTSYLRTIINSTGISMTNTSNTITEKTNFANGTGISITGTGKQTFTNTGVISNSCVAPIVCSGTNPSTISFADSPYWQFLCSNTGSGSSVSCGNFTAKKQLFIQISFNVTSTGTAIVPALRFNSDNGSNYSWRNSFDGGADTTGTTSSTCAIIGSNTVGNSGGGIITIVSDMNQANLRKIMWINEAHGIESNAGTAPTHSETGCKWSNTTNQITKITLLTSSGTATYSTGTEITVWGHD